MRQTQWAIIALAFFNLHAAPEPGPRLIVRGDDMGYTHSGNVALIQSHVSGIETSVEVLVPSPWLPEAVELLRRQPKLDVGVHLTLTSEWDNVKWRPLTRGASLVDQNGYLRSSVRPNPAYPGQSVLENKWLLADVEAEFRAQIELAKRLIPQLSHVSGHMGCIDFDPNVAALVRRLTREYGIDIDPAEHGVQRLSYSGPHATPVEKRESFLAAVATMQPGQTYLFVEHPGLDGEELRAVYFNGYSDVARDRQGVTQLWTDPSVKAELERRGVQLISYRELRRK